MKLENNKNKTTPLVLVILLVLFAFVFGEGTVVANAEAVAETTSVQEVIDKEIRPLLEHDGGSIELVDLNGNNVIVRLTGRCSSCPSAGVTLKYTVQDKLREFVSSDLTVESI